MSALRLPILIIFALLLSGCTSLFSFNRDEVKPVEVLTKEVERTPLNLPNPEPIEPLPFKWIVITPENAEKVWEKLQEKDTDLVLFGLTDEGYEAISINMVQIRNYIDKQRTIILKYKEYYETPKDPATE